ncbi:amidohydrolase family protein [Phenylobacterium sp.]|jgi:imidazolonepropionase-like amidohydrolase|uniref:amidohydrolase family protein n=1 Tax=Phenylobacterium sp. TaxID=1871053 RepID=UPI002F40C1A9
MGHRRAAALLAGLALGAIGGPALAATERFSVVSEGKTVGHMVVDDRPAAQDVRFDYRNNGRGPTLHERLALSPAGIPTSWTVEGTTAFGGGVQEAYSWAQGHATWRSQADQGSAEAAQPPLYVVNDGTPWSTAVYAHVLLKRPNHTADVLPKGRLRLSELRRTTIGKLTVTAYALDGVNLQPDILITDRAGKLFAVYRQDPGSAPQIVIREGREADFTALQALGKALAIDQARALQAKAAHRFDTPIRIKNVRVFDPQTEALTEPKSVVVFRGRISAVEPYRPAAPDRPDETVIDGQGGTLIAGLHDMHSHTTVQSGALYLAAGVTTTRDMGNDNLALLDLIQRIGAGETPGPHIVRSGLLEGRSPYSTTMGLLPATLAEAITDVDRYADRGYWQIKIYNSMTPAWVKPIAAEAHRLGLRVAGHIPAFMSADQAVEDGYDELTHANLLMLSWILDTTKEDTRTSLRITALSRAAKLDFASPKVQATLALMRAHNTAFDPTAAIMERLMLSRAGQVQEGDQPYLDHMPIGYQRFRRRSFVDVSNPAADAAFRKGFDKVLELIRILDQQGTRILPGTDDPSGFTLHRELELYVKAGLAPGKVLRMATLDCDRYLGRDQDFGSIARGKAADLILVAGDPTRNIRDIRQVRMTMKGGVVYFPSELYQAMAISPFAAPPPLRPAAAGAQKVMSSQLAGASGLQSGFGEDID